ncbi:hypothetical protein H311_03610 [Anncaliia algerae PRA109]|nr:hypothetical protein H311_03610 [Anncaliia algerae PRA109]
MVQINESKCGRRKYNRSHNVDGVWFFGGVEVISETKLYCVPVLKRDSLTLTDLVKKSCLNSNN